MATATKPRDRKGSVVVTFRLTGAKKEQVMFFPGRIPGGFRRKLSAIAETIQTQGTWIPEQVHVQPKPPVKLEEVHSVSRPQYVPEFKAKQAAKMLEAKANQKQQLCTCPATGIVFTVGMPDMGFAMPMPHPLSILENVEKMVRSNRPLESLPLVVLAGGLMTLLKSKGLLNWKNASWANAILERAGKETLCASLRFWTGRNRVRGIAAVWLDQSNLDQSFKAKTALLNLMERTKGEDASLIPVDSIEAKHPEHATKLAVLKAKVHVNAKAEAKAIKSQSQNGKELLKALKGTLPNTLYLNLAMALANLAVIRKDKLAEMATRLMEASYKPEAKALAAILSNVDNTNLSNEFIEWEAEPETEKALSESKAAKFDDLLKAALARANGGQK